MKRDDDLKMLKKHIFVMNNIFFIGETLAQVVSQDEKQTAVLVKSFTLLSKDGPCNTDGRADIPLFDIEDHCVVEYGLDYKAYYQGFPDIYTIKAQKSMHQSHYYNLFQLVLFFKNFYLIICLTFVRMCIQIKQNFCKHYMSYNRGIGS